MHVEESSKSSLLKLKDQYSHTVAMSFSREELEFSGGFNWALGKFNACNAAIPSCKQISPHFRATLDKKIFVTSHDRWELMESLDPENWASESFGARDGFSSEWERFFS